MSATYQDSGAVFTRDDIQSFIHLAESEGWMSEAWELEFLLEAFPSGCMVCRVNSAPIAFITAITYGLSGWIGNLIVHREWRRQGIGSALFTRALEQLDQSGVLTVWLTASEAGRPLYENHGFIAIDTVNRWEGRCRPAHSESSIDLDDVLDIDRAGWGDCRGRLLHSLLRRGTVAAFPHGFLVLQNWATGLQIGPWGCKDNRTAASLLKQVCIPDNNGRCMFLDVPGRNRAAHELLEAAGFHLQSSTTLMYRGKAPDYNPENIFALASMGSMG